MGVRLMRMGRKACAPYVSTERRRSGDVALTLPLRRLSLSQLWERAEDQAGMALRAALFPPNEALASSRSPVPLSPKVGRGTAFS